MPSPKNHLATKIRTLVQNSTGYASLLDAFNNLADRFCAAHPAAPPRVRVPFQSLPRSRLLAECLQSALSLTAWDGEASVYMGHIFVDPVAAEAASVQAVAVAMANHKSDLESVAAAAAAGGVGRLINASQYRSRGGKGGGKKKPKKKSGKGKKKAKN